MFLRRLFGGRAARGPKLPNFFIIGANKGGTTSLAMYLDEHPQAFLCWPKEPHFFGRVDLLQREPGPVAQGGAMLKKYAQDALSMTTLDEYATLFAKAPAGVIAIGEASTGYLASQRAARNIRHVLPQARLVVSLRNPAERAFSNYKMYRKEGLEQGGDFMAIIRENPGNWYVNLGYYGRQLAHWLSLFPRDQLRVYLFEDLAADPAAVCRDVFSFLGVSPSFVPDVGRRYNVSESREDMPEEARAFLTAIYREDILRLQDLIRRDLSAWLG
ncbi:MAG TPA: sulfotransferase [bacterium]